MEKARISVLHQISGGEFRKIGRVSYIINNKKVHIKGKSGNSYKYPFNINKTVLSADFEVYICGNDQQFYIIPNNIIKMMYNDPSAMFDSHHPDYTIIDVIPSKDRIVFGTGGKLISISEYKSQTIINVEKNISKTRKGFDGEGIHHLMLKNWIAENPSFLNIENVIKKEIDNHIFPSGDRPDIIFHYNIDKYATVEIETDNPEPGAYQAIKYRDLLCAELGLELLSTKVSTILVAWEISEYLKEFCHRYEIQCFEKKI